MLPSHTNGIAVTAQCNRNNASVTTFVTYKQNTPTQMMKRNTATIPNELGTVTIGSIPEGLISHSLPYQLISSTDINTVSFCPLDA